MEGLPAPPSFMPAANFVHHDSDGLLPSSEGKCHISAILVVSDVKQVLTGHVMPLCNMPLTVVGGDSKAQAS
jgi:hypothetical protein